MSNRSFFAVMAVLALVGLLSFGVFGGGEGVEVGQAAPVEPLPLLDGSGEASLADFEGSWVLVNFWASWCPPCRTEAPAIEDYAEEMADQNLVVVGINTEDNTDDGKEFVDEFDLSWTMLRDGNGAFKDRYGIRGLPESFLVDPQGRIARIRRGSVSAADLDELFTPLVSGSGAAN